MPWIKTRRQLYDLVWSRPTREVAADLGISDVMIGKLCKRYCIPKPPRGYWAKLAAGKRVIKAKLVISGALREDEVVIREPEPWIAKERAQAKLVKQELRATRKVNTTIKTLDYGAPKRAFHAVVQKTVQFLRQTKPDEHGGLIAQGNGLAGVTVATENVERGLSTLDAIVRGLEAAGLNPTATGHGITISHGPDSISFTIFERSKRRDHVLTEAERRREAKFAKKLGPASALDKVFGSPIEIFRQQNFRKYDFVYQGLLVVEANVWSADGARKRWADGKIQRVDRMTGEIVSGLQFLLNIRRKKREEEEKRERERLERAHRERLLELRRERENERNELISRVIRNLEQVELLQNWRAILLKTDHANFGPEFTRLLAWLDEKINQLRSQVQFDAVVDHLRERDLFPNPDPLFDPEGDPS